MAYAKREPLHGLMARLTRLDMAPDPIDRLLARLRKRDGPWAHSSYEARPSDEGPDPDEGVAWDADEGVNRPQGGGDRQDGDR